MATTPSVTPGQQVWVADAAECYQLAKVSAISGGTVTATTQNGQSVSTKEFFAFDADDAGEQDLVQMVHVDTANILNTLRSRHKSGAVYTSVGNIVVSVNPYRWIDIYSKATIREHFEAFGTKDLMPHVFTLASDAYKALCTSGQSQTIITSGESGAGKTENAKQVFRFLAEVAVSSRPATTAASRWTSC